MYVHHMHTVLCSRGQKETLDPLQLELRCVEVLVSQHVGVGTQPGSLPKQQALLTPKPPPQPPQMSLLRNLRSSYGRNLLDKEIHILK